MLKKIVVALTLAGVAVSSFAGPLKPSMPLIGETREVVLKAMIESKNESAQKCVAIIQGKFESQEVEMKYLTSEERMKVFRDISRGDISKIRACAFAASGIATQANGGNAFPSSGEITVDKDQYRANVNSLIAQGEFENLFNRNLK